MKKCIYLNTENDMEESYKIHHTVLLSSRVVWWHCFPFSYTSRSSHYPFVIRHMPLTSFPNCLLLASSPPLGSLSWEKSICPCPQTPHSFSSQIFHTTVSHLSKFCSKRIPLLWLPSLYTKHSSIPLRQHNLAAQNVLELFYKSRNFT